MLLTTITTLHGPAHWLPRPRHIIRYTSKSLSTLLPTHSGHQLRAVCKGGVTVGTGVNSCSAGMVQKHSPHDEHGRKQTAKLRLVRFTTRLGERIVKTVKREGILQSGKKNPLNRPLNASQERKQWRLGQSDRVMSIIDGHSSRRSSQVAGQDPIPNILFQSLNQVSLQK